MFLEIPRISVTCRTAGMGTMVAAIIPWSAWVIGYGVLLGTTVREFIPFVFLCILSPIVALINAFLGYGLFHKDDEVKYNPFWRRKKVL